MFLRGVNLAGAELSYGTSNTTNPVSGTDYLFISHQDIDYLVSKKINFVRLLISWEMLQPNLNQPLANNAYHTTLQDRVAYFTNKGVSVMIEIHGASDTNFARYKGNVIGSTAVPNSAFADFWSRMATIYKNNPLVIFGLMNEPTNISTMQWYAAAQAAINGIRSTGAANMIMVPGNGWTGAGSWLDNWYDTATTKVSNANGWLTLRDPANNLCCSVHMYLDPNAGGGTNDIVSATIGVERMTKLVTWARANNIRVHLSEFGASSANSLAPTAVKNLLDYINANQDIVIGWAWWAYGPPSWWGGYRFTLCPKNNYTTDDSKWTWLAPYLLTSQPAPAPTPNPSPTPTPSPTYPTVTYDQYGFFHLNSEQSAYVGYKPNTYNASQPIALLVWLHGCGGNAEGDLWSVAPPATRANQNYIVISIGGRDGACWQPNVDAPKILAAIADVKKYFNIDPRKIYLGGYSSGGDITYRVGFENAGMFAGLLVENSDPFLGTGKAASELMSAASWKINIAHLAHTSDTTFPITTVRNSITTLKNNGFPATLIEKPGTHWDNDAGTSGTKYDLVNFLLPYLNVGWQSPGATPAPNPSPTPTPSPGPTSIVNMKPTTTTIKSPGDQGFTSSKVVGDGYTLPAGTYLLKAATRTTYGDNTSVVVDIIMSNDQTNCDIDWESMTIDMRGHTIQNFWNCTITGTTGIVNVKPLTATKTVRAMNKNSFGFSFARNPDKNKAHYQVLIKGIKW